MSPCYSEINRGRAVEPHSRNWGSQITWLTFVGHPLSQLFLSFLLIFSLWTIIIQLLSRLMVRGTMYRSSLNVTIQVQCLFVTWLPRYKVLAFTKENHEDQNQFSLPLWRDNTHGLKFASFIYYRQLCAKPEGSLFKDHFTIDQSDCMICNTALWFVNRRVFLLKSDLEMNQHQWTWTCASCHGRAYMAPLTLPLANQIAPFATLWFVSLRAEVILQNH